MILKKDTDALFLSLLYDYSIQVTKPENIDKGIKYLHAMRPEEERSSLQRRLIREAIRHCS